MEAMTFDFLDNMSFTVINFLYKQTFYTAVLFAIILVLAYLLRKKSPQWQMGLWALILIRLLLPIDLSLPGSIRNLFDQVPNINTLTAPIDAIGNIINQNNISESVLNNSPQNLIDTMFSWHLISAFIWGIGCLMMFIFVFRKYLGSYRIVKTASTINEEKYTDFIAGLCHQLNIKRTVTLISSDDFLSPFSIGVFEPLIYLPQSLIKSGDMDTINSILAHEMIHIKHYDALWIKLQNLLQIIFFFNPVVWYANRQINIAREQICDTSVLNREIILPEVYGNSLIQVLKGNYFGYDLVDLLPCFTSHKKIFKQRIQNISKGGNMKKQKTLLTVLTLCLIGTFVLPLAGTSSIVRDVNVPSAIINETGGRADLQFKLVDDEYTDKAMEWVADNYQDKKLPDEINGQNQLLLQISNDIKLPQKFELLFHYVRDQETDKLIPQDIMVVDRTSTLGGNDIIEALIKFNHENTPFIDVQMNTRGAVELKRLTRAENKGRRLAIIVGKKIRTAPRINAQIVGGKGAIFGDFSLDEVIDLVEMLRGSSVPLITATGVTVTENGTIYSGEVVITFENNKGVNVRADQIIKNKDEFILEGNVEIKFDNNVFRGEKVSISNIDNSVKIKGVDGALYSPNAQ